MSVENGSFEQQGARPGAATGWTLEAVTQAQRVAAFGTPAYGTEGFVWGMTLAEARVAPMQVALFDAVPEAIEDFVDGWGADVYLRAIAATEPAATFNGGIAEIDTFAAGWGVSTFLRVWDDVTDADGLTDSFTQAGYVRTLLGAGAAPTSTASFTGGPTVETFTTDNWTAIGSL